MFRRCMLKTGVWSAKQSSRQVIDLRLPANRWVGFSNSSRYFGKTLQEGSDVGLSPSSKTVYIKDSLVSDVIKYYYTKEGYDETTIAEDTALLQQHRVRTLAQWYSLTEEEKDKDGYPRMLRKVLDRVCQEVFGKSNHWLTRYEDVLLPLDDAVGILSSMVTVSGEHLQKSTVRNFVFSSFEHREAGKEYVIAAANENYKSFFRNITESTNAQDSMVRKYHYFTTVIGGSGSGKSRASCEIGSILRSAGQSDRLPREFAGTCEIYIDFFNANTIATSEKDASSALGLRIFIRALRKESNVNNFVEAIGEDTFKRLMQNGVFKFDRVMSVLAKTLHQSRGTIEAIPLVLILDEFQTTLKHFDKELLNIIVSYMCDLSELNKKLVRDRLLLMPVISGTLSSSITEMFLPTGYGVTNFPLPSFPINIAKKLALREGIPAEMFNGLELQRFWYVMSLVPRNLERAVVIVKQLLQRYGDVVANGSERDMFVQQLFQKVTNELDKLHFELTQQRESSSSTDLTPLNPYSDSEANDTLLLQYALTGVKLVKDVSWITKLEHQGKIYTTSDRRLFLPYIVFKRLLEINNLLPSDCLPLLRRFFFWQHLKELDLHILTNRITLLSRLGCHYVKVSDLFPGCYAAPSILGLEVEVQDHISFERESNPFIHTPKEKLLCIDNPKLHPIKLDSGEVIPIGSGLENDYVLGAPLNHPKTDGRWFTKTKKQNVLFVIQYKYSSKNVEPNVGPLDWIESFSNQMSQKYNGYKIVYVYITNADIKTKAEMAVQQKRNLIVIDGSVAPSYFAPGILPYFTFIDPTEDALPENGTTVKKNTVNKK